MAGVGLTPDGFCCGLLRLVTFQPILQYTDNNRHTQVKSYLFLIYNSNMKHLIKYNESVDRI